MRLTALAIASEGSCGVEKIFRMRSRRFSIQTQSVNVPPVSTAMRKTRDPVFLSLIGASSCSPATEALGTATNIERRRGFSAAAASYFSGVAHQQIGSHEDKQHHRDNAIHGEERRV